MAKRNKGTAGLKLVTAETRDVGEQFRDLYDRANKQTGAKESDAEALRELLRNNPEARLWERVAGPMSAAQNFALKYSEHVTPGIAECWRERLDAVRKELAGEGASEIERLLAHHAALCWFRLAEVELKLTSYLGTRHTLTSGIYYERRLTMAQRRFTRAVETLARARALLARAEAARAAAERARGGGVPARKAG